MPIDASIPLSARAPAINTPFENLGQMMQLRQQQQHMQSQQALEEERRLKVQKEQRDQAEREALARVIGNPDFTRDTFLEEVRTKAPSAYFDAVKQFEEQDKRALDIQQAKAAYAEKQSSYASGLAAAVKANDYNPAAFELALKHAESVFPDFGARAAEYRQLATEKGPDAIRSIVNGLIAQTPSVAAESRQAGADARQAAEQAITLPSRTPNAQGLTPSQAQAAQPKVGTFEDYVQRAAEAKGKTPAQLSPLDIRRAKSEYDAAGRAPTEPKYVEVTVQENGQWVNKRVPESEARGQSYPVAPSAAERMDALKFSKARPVMTGIGELSERINTLKGVVATASGKAEKAKASVNLNDDVAEYESLVSGFTPMVARALGHTGVLTQQDVDSVKNLFPKPEDSKTLRDRKIKRMGDIFADLESAGKDDGQKAAPTATGRMRVRGPNGETGTVPAGTSLPAGWTKAQ